MFVIYEKNKQRLPIKVWLKSIDDLEPECLEQALNLSNLPFSFKHIALMPDTHTGYGMPIGGVLATEDVIVPNAVGVDQGCGMCFVQTNIPVQLLKGTQTDNGNLVQAIIGDIMRTIPTGFESHKEPMIYYDVPRRMKEEDLGNYLVTFEKEIENLSYQLGTLGGGNHFIELQEDEDGMLAIMVHSGSRNFGYKVANFFNEVAKDLNKRWFSSVQLEQDLAFLPISTSECREFRHILQIALDFAEDNRTQMVIEISKILNKRVKPVFDGIEFSMETNAHHNYVAQENHFGKNVWVHRKGAIRARKGDMGIIPGAMGSYSYIVEGLGNDDSFHTCSHGAGRKMSRKKASESITVNDMMNDLKEKDVVLGTKHRDNVTDESRFAYKDIGEVMDNQQDLVRVIKKLKTVAVVKGSEKKRRKR